MELSAHIRPPASTDAPVVASLLSAEAARLRDCLGLHIAPFPTPADSDPAVLRAYSERLNRAIQSRSGALPLWHDDEVCALEANELSALERTWRQRVERHPRWCRAANTLVPRDEYVSIWRAVTGGDFAVDRRGGNYTRGMAAFQASRWVGTRTLGHLLGASVSGPDQLFLDVLGGDGYVWRVLQAERALSSFATRGPLVMTNDISPHMFFRAGTWGMPTREDAEHLSRTFSANAFDGVLFAYGTHHVRDLCAAVREGARVLKQGGTIVVHDFIDEGPAGQWFHRVVDRHSKTGHDIPHVGPVHAAVALFEAGLHDVELFEIDDPFLFAATDGTSAIDVAEAYLLGMYGMEDSFGARRDVFRSIVEETLTYPETGNTPIFSDALVYIPRRAVVARAQKAEGDHTSYSDSDQRLIDTLGRLFRTPASTLLDGAALPPHAVPYWFSSDGSRWGVSAERQESFARRFTVWR